MKEQRTKTEKIKAFVKEHRGDIALAAGAVILIAMYCNYRNALVFKTKQCPHEFDGKSLVEIKELLKDAKDVVLKDALIVVNTKTRNYGMHVRDAI